MFSLLLKELQILIVYCSVYLDNAGALGKVVNRLKRRQGKTAKIQKEKIFFIAGFIGYLLSSSGPCLHAHVLGIDFSNSSVKERALLVTSLRVNLG